MKKLSIGDRVVIEKHGHNWKGHIGTIINIINDGSQAIVEYNDNLNPNALSIMDTFNCIDIVVADNLCIAIYFSFKKTYILEDYIQRQF